MDLHLKDRIAFITGANRGIGEAIARAFAAEGVHLALFARNLDQANDVAAQIRAESGVRVHVAYIDFLKPETLPPAVEAAHAALGGVDILVNSAGGAKRGHFHEVADADWDACFAVKPLGLIRMTRAVLPFIGKSDQARIINLAGVRGKEPTTFSAVAGPINAGTNAITKIMANELGPRGITVNSINPGSTNTRRWDNLIEVVMAEQGISRDAAEAHLVAEIPIGRVVDVKDISAAALFLASAHAKTITGAALNIDGGRSRSIL